MGTSKLGISEESDSFNVKSDNISSDFDRKRRVFIGAELPMTRLGLGRGTMLREGAYTLIIAACFVVLE